jgi:hypothetical protein
MAVQENRLRLVAVGHLGHPTPPEDRGIMRREIESSAVWYKHIIRLATGLHFWVEVPVS